MPSDWQPGEVRFFGLRPERAGWAFMVFGGAVGVLAIIAALVDFVLSLVIAFAVLAAAGALISSAPRQLFDLRRLPRPLAVLVSAVLVAAVVVLFVALAYIGSWTLFAVVVAAYIASPFLNPEPVQRAFERIDPRRIDVRLVASNAPSVWATPLRVMLGLLKSGMVAVYPVAGVLLIPVVLVLLIEFRLWQWTYFLFWKPALGVFFVRGTGAWPRVRRSVQDPPERTPLETEP